MNTKHRKGWMKHWDFILIDILVLQVSFILAYWLVRGLGNPYALPAYAAQGNVLFVSQLLVILMRPKYSGILRRKRYDEFLAVCRFIFEIEAIAIFYFFLVHQTGIVSRLQYGITVVLFIFLDYFLRTANKFRILRSKNNRHKKSVVLITSEDKVKEALNRLNSSGIYTDFFVAGVIVLDKDEIDHIDGVNLPVGPVNERSLDRISHGWVDEVFILQPDNLPFPTKLMDDLMEMGITVDYTVAALNDEKWPINDMKKLGNYKVLSSSVRFASAEEMGLKRIMDILGGIVGCLICGILLIIVGPIIYHADPGPIFYSQERIGTNGRTFKIYKFRSMYIDADKRKAELIAKNKMSDGMMFKVDDDPRIIGSEKKDKNGKPKGIGNFIRKTSIDEFPQFWCVLKGDMSLVGWRPCTKDEWIKYGMQHRIRAAMKPGITGMWQVSGRSQITDFDEIVALDREYIENWSLQLDIKILLKTVWVVLTRKGAE